jgi:type I restriction enzyme R subunit
MANSKEAKARIKINRLLEKAGWRFFDDENGKANIELEQNVKPTQKNIDALGNDFEGQKNGFVDFTLFDDQGYPILVLEAKSESKIPYDGKEQARRYAQNLNCRFVILSNGDSHYFWDLERGDPEVITEFPTQESLQHRQEFTPDNSRLAEEKVDAEYIAVAKYPNLKDDPRYKNETLREQLLFDEDLHLLRPYQLKAIEALQKSAAEGNDRFLFEMATGTGKTLISAAVIKLFLRTGNAKRILFLVDRVELERQASRNFNNYLQNDYHSVIYKNNRDDWKKAEIVISTVQSLSVNDKYKKLFSPTDFDLVISDEAHRSIGGNSRAVFEYFIGYKLGLTATPKDYLKNINPQQLSQKDPRAWEKRQLLDTYKTFGCTNDEPTYRFNLTDGVRHGFLINPVVVDTRTDITAKLLSEKGYAVTCENNDSENEENYFHSDFERKFFSENTNHVFCETFIKNAIKDPISGEIGKSIVFCVSQDHASKITQILNQIATQNFPDKYNSDFAVQVTSRITNAQQFTINFAHNNLNGKTRFLEGYKSGKTRVCVTVGMMTTGYDCKDILNLVLMRPIFSPTDFIQIKGRGTRKYTFKYTDENGEKYEREKERFKLFDFFANCEFFEERYNYDEVLKLPVTQNIGNELEMIGVERGGEIEIFEPDKVKTITETSIGIEGMKIDRKLFEKAQTELQKDNEIKNAIDNEQWDKAVQILREKYEDKPELFLNLEKIRQSENLDRRLTWREFLERVFGLIDGFKTKEEKLEEECEKFIVIHKPESKYIPYIKDYIKAYVTDERFRTIIKKKHYVDLNFYAGFTMSDFRSLNGWRDILPQYIKDYISINQYLI